MTEGKENKILGPGGEWQSKRERRGGGTWISKKFLSNGLESERSGVRIPVLYG